MTAGEWAAIQVLGTSAHGPLDPSFRVRLAMPGRALAAHGIAMRELPLFSLEQARRFRSSRAPGKAATLVQARRRLAAELRAQADQASAVFIQQRIDLAPSLMLERLALKERRLIYDIDDAAWLSGKQAGGHRLSPLKGAARKVRWLAERADHILAGSEFLAEHLSQHGDTISVVPSLVDTSTYEIRRHEQGLLTTLGWIGSPTTARYLEHIAPALERFARCSARGVRLIVVGATAPRLSQVEVQERSWSPASERATLSEMDIGLMPLEDTLWARGKCAYKALQYMACGVPPLVSDVGISAAVVGDAGWVAADETSWVEGLHALAEDPDLRTRLGAVGRRRVEQDFSFTRWIPVLARIFKQA